MRLRAFVCSFVRSFASSPQDGLTYADRVLWGLLFFLVVGVILFDIVTGIIIDKFSELRERTLHRFRTLRDVGFISDIGRSEYEERGPEFKFDKLQAREEAARPPRAARGGAARAAVVAVDGDPSSRRGGDSCRRR